MCALAVVSESPRILRKAKEIVHISNNISLIQRRMVNALLLNAYEQLLTETQHSISIPTLCEMIGFDSNNIEHLKEGFKSLMKIQFEWDILDSEEQEWILMTAISQARIKGNVLYYEYASLMRETLSNPRIYALIDINLLGEFRSNYGLALYETVMRFRDDGATEWFTLSVFKKLMGVANDKSSRDAFKVLNRDVIKPSVAEINRLADIAIEAEFLRESRKVTQIRFLITKKAQSSLGLSSGGLTFDAELLHTLQNDYGLTEKQAKEILTITSDVEVREVLEYVDETVKAGGIKKTVQSFTYAALKGGFKRRETKFDRQNKKDAEKAAKITTEKEITENLRAEFAYARKQKVDDSLLALSEDERDALEIDFVVGLDKTMAGFYKKSGMESQLVKSAYFRFLCEKFLLEECYLDFAKFCTQRNGLRLSSR